MELQLQVTEEELLEFPEVRPDQINTSHTDNSVGEVVLSTEKSSFQSSCRGCRSCGSCSVDTPSKLKAERQHYRQPIVHKRQSVRWQTFEHRKKKDGQLATDPVHIPTDNVHTPSIFDTQVRPNLMAFAKTLTPKALRYLYLGIDLGRTIGDCSQ